MSIESIDRETLIERGIASMIALAVGDAAGDLGRDDEVRQKYGILTKLLSKGKSTDDTEFSVLSARALLDCRGEFTSQFVADTWRRLVIEKGGAKDRGGIPLYGALWNLSQGIDPPLSGRNNVFAIDDGAAMRAVPYGIAAAGDPDEAARLAGLDACVSHDRDGLWASQAVAASIAIAITGGSVEEVITAGRKFIPETSWLGSRMRTSLAIVDETEDPFLAYEKLHTALWTPRHSAAPEAISQIYALYKMAKGEFNRGFVLAANFGRDADTITALVLAFCAAGSGLSAIPEKWVEQVRYPAGVCLPFAADEDMVELGKRLAEYAINKRS